MGKTTAIDDEQSIANLKSEAKHLFGHENGQVSRFPNLFQNARDFLDDGWLNSFRRLIQDKHLRFRDQRPRNRQLLLLPAREVSTFPMPHLVEHGEEGKDIRGNLAGFGILQAS